MSSDSSISLQFSSSESVSKYDNLAKVLLIGDTGAGKSTFINYLANYFHHGNLDHLKVAIPCKFHPYPTEHYPHTELNIDDNTQSKTSACTQYIFTDSTTQKQYLFLDTPGLSDTRGTEQSEINLNKIIEAITQLGNLTTVIIVVNGSISRLTICLRSVIATLNGNLPDVILENVIVVLTNAKKHESPFDLQMLNLHGKVYPFYMQNNVFVSDPQTWKQSIREELQTDWDYSMHQIQRILQTLDSFKQVSINAFHQMQQLRNDIKTIIHQARLELIQIQKIQNELAQLDLALQRADRDVQTYQNHTRVHTIEKVELVDAPYHSTLCANCNEVCHNNCRLNETRYLGDQIFSHCLVMNNGICQQCRNHCSYLDHYHAKKTIQITYETLHDLLVDLKKKYDQAWESRRNYQEKIFTNSEMKELSEKTLRQKINQLKGKSNELCRICSAFNLAQELKCLIKQLKLEGDLFEDLETKAQGEQLVRSLTRFTRLFEEQYQEKSRRKRPAMQIISTDASIESKPNNINTLKTSDLLDLHKKTSDRALLDSILEELYRRVQGKSTGPLSTPNEVLIIHRYLDKYKQKSIHDLSYTYRQLQKQINDIVKSNIFRINDVNPELLIENFIVQSLLDDKEKTDSPPPPPRETFPLHTATMSLSRPINRSHSTPLYPLPYPTDVVPLTSSDTPSLSSRPIGISHILSAPYPSPDQPSILPALPVDSPVFQGRKSQSSEPIFRLEDYRNDSTDSKSSRSSIDYRDSMRMPMPTNSPPSLPSSAEFSRRKSIESQHTMPSIYFPSKSDMLSPTNSPQTPRHQQTADLDYEKFRTLDNSQLLSMYAQGNLQKHEIRRAAIHQELERRCYGDHPMLIDEKRHFFAERMKINERKTIGELLIAQATIKQKIRAYLKDNDVTLIDEIPVELIIEANALNQLILSKG